MGDNDGLWRHFDGLLFGDDHDRRGRVGRFSVHSSPSHAADDQQKDDNNDG